MLQQYVALIFSQKYPLLLAKNYMLCNRLLQFVPVCFLPKSFASSVLNSDICAISIVVFSFLFRCVATICCRPQSALFSAIIKTALWLCNGLLRYWPSNHYLVFLSVSLCNNLLCACSLFFSALKLFRLYFLSSILVIFFTNTIRKSSLLCNPSLEMKTGTDANHQPRINLLFQSPFF